MENKAKIGFLILLIFYIILAENEMWGPVIITGDTPAEAILKLSNTPAAVSAESVLVKRYDSTVSNYPINNIKTTKIQWDSVTSKPTAYNPVLHQHDSIYYRETEVNNLLSSKSDTSHTHPQSKINGLVDTITNHRNAIASKFATADTNKLARKSHIHNISDVNNLSTELSNRYTKTELQTSGSSQVHWGNITNKPSTFAPSSHVHAIADVTSLQANLDGKLDKNHVSNNVYNYRSVYTIRFTGVTHNITGTLKINLPSSWNNVRYRFEMRGYAYSNNFNTYGSWRYVGSGFAYSPDSKWYLQGGQFLEGNPTFNQVRYTHDGSRCCILLGDTTTTWTDYTSFPVIIDIDVITDAPISRDGWSFEVLTSEDGYAWGNIQSITPSTYAPSAHGHAWSEITSKPSTFAPAAHGLVSSTHTVSGLTAGHVLKALSATTYGFGAIAWSEIASKPSTFTPSAHTHPWSEIASKPSTFAPASHTHPWSGITDKPSSIAYKNEFNVFTAPSGISIDDVTAEDDVTSTTNWNVVSHLQLVSNNNKMAFFLGQPQNERKAFIQVGHASSRYGSYLGELRLNPYGGNVTVNGYGIWHSGNFDPSTKANATHGHPWGDITGKPSTFAPAAHALVSHSDWSTYFNQALKTTSTPTFAGINITNTALIGKTTATPGGGYKLEVEGDAFINGDLLLNAITAYGYLNLRNDILLLNKAENGWLSFATRDVSGSEAKFSLSNIADVDGVGPITLSDGVGGYFQLYNNSGQGRAVLKAKNNIMCFTVESPTLPEADAIRIARDAGSLGDGIPIVDIYAVTLMNENVYIQSDVNISHNSLVCLSGAVRYNYIHHIGSVPTIDTDNYPGIYLIPSNPNNYTLTGGAPEQRIFVGNRSTHVQQVEGYRIEPGQFRDFLKTGTGWIASGASISGKTTNVSHGTGNISVSNVSTVHINYTPTSTYMLTDGYVGQRVTVVVLSGSAQHWIQGATKAHKIVPGEFRDFIYTTDGWVASAADY